MEFLLNGFSWQSSAVKLINSQVEMSSLKYGFLQHSTSFSHLQIASKGWLKTESTVARLPSYRLRNPFGKRKSGCRKAGGS